MGHSHNDEHINPTAIELFPGSSAGHGGYIDFHYNDSTSDYTSRIIEKSLGVFQIYGSIGMDGTLTAPRLNTSGGLSIPMSMVRNDKSNTDTNWYQDIQFSTSDNIRVSVIRSQIDSSGDRTLGLYVSSNTNAAPVGITVKRVDSNGSYTYVFVPSNNASTTAQIRNISAGTTAKTSGSSSLTNGYIYVQYE